MAAAAAAPGRLTAQAAVREGGAWCACFPVSRSADRLLSVGLMEQSLTDTLRDLCRQLHARRTAVTKPELHTACRRAKKFFCSEAALAAERGELCPWTERKHGDAGLCSRAAAACEASSPAWAAPTQTTEVEAETAGDSGEPSMPHPDWSPPAEDSVDAQGRSKK